MNTSEFNTLDPASTDRGVGDLPQISGQCEITRCGRAADQMITHPQRGQMAACKVHTRRIRSLDDTRFRGGVIS